MIMAQELNTSTTGYLDTVDRPPIYVESEGEPSIPVSLLDGPCKKESKMVGKKRKLENGHANGVSVAA